MGRLLVVPPPNNFAWPEGGIFRLLIEAGGRAFMPMGSAHVGEESGYSIDPITNLSRSFNESLQRFPLDDNDVLLFCEAFTTDPLQVHVVAGMTQRPRPKIVSLMHGGSFIPDDELALPYQIEGAVLSANDLTVSPSGWAWRLQREAYPSLPCEIRNWPIDGAPSVLFGRMESANRLPSIVFPHRRIAAKGYPLWERLPNEMPDVVFTETRVGRPMPRDQYWSLLVKTKAVFASPTMETYGIAVEEAMAAGCCPVLLDHPTYRELWGDNFVHWHSGNTRSARQAIEAAMTCNVVHYTYSAAEHRQRAKEILACAESSVS